MNNNDIRIPFNTSSAIANVLVWAAFFMFVAVMYGSIAEHQSKPTIENLVDNVQLHQ